MSFDLRQNVLMVRSLVHGQPFYNFYNAEGLDFTLPGYQLKEIYDCHFEGRMSGVTTYWGFSNKPNCETFEFADNGDLIWAVSLNAVCHTLLPFEMIIGHEGFNVINGFEISRHKRTVMQIHQKAVGRSVEKLTWFRDMPEGHMRELLNALGHGPLRIERADREELIKIHRDWQRKHDEEFKYTHNACGIDPDDKLPADLYDDHGHRISRRMLAAHKTVEMMANEISTLIRIFDLDPKFNHSSPMWEFGLAVIAERFIYAENAKDVLADFIENTQFVVNGIYALARDYDWRQINEEPEEYRQSLIRRLLQELRNEIEAEDSMYVVEDGRVLLKAVSVTADTDVVDEVEEDEDAAAEVRTFLEGLSESKLRHYAKLFKLASKIKLLKMDHAALVDLCADYCGSNWPEDLEEEDEDEPEKERAPRKFPATRSADTYDYVRIRKVLVWLKLLTGSMSSRDADCSREDVELNRKKAVSVLRNAVKDGKLDTLKEIHLKSLAYALTKMKDGDRYPRDTDYLKELIKHALR